jgi:hypothetical protein
LKRLTRKRVVYVAMIVAVVGLLAGGANAEDIDLGMLDDVTKRFQFAIQVGSPGGDDHRLLYADLQRHIHVYKIEDGELELEWETTNLGARVTSMFVADLYGDGTQKLVVSTAGGRILIYTMGDYNLDWENLQDKFDRVNYMVSDNLDDDPQHELVFVADNILHIYDSLNKNFEWQSQTEFEANEIVIGNVDDDDQPEIVLNTGAIIDSRFYNVEFQADNPFGDRISLLDINGDGVPEIFGEFLDFSLKIFDIYAEREIW